MVPRRDNTDVPGHARWFHAIVADLQVVLGALPYATPLEAADLLCRFAGRVPSPVNPSQASSLDHLFRRILRWMDGQVLQSPHLLPSQVRFDFDSDASGPGRFGRAIERLVEGLTDGRNQLEAEEHSAHDGDVKSGGEHWRIAAFHLYLQREYSNPTLQQTDAAAAVGITPAHLSRLLRQKTKRSFTWHRDTYRLRAAKRLLRETAKTLKEVAAEVGYASDAQLCRRFQERCGSTPLGYRTEVLLGRLQRATVPCASEPAQVPVPSRSTSGVDWSSRSSTAQG
jgi:AraC-like DNA-binding protein